MSNASRDYSALEIVSISTHALANIAGISANLLLIFLILFKTPRFLRVYSVLLFNSAFIDFVGCVAAVFVMQRYDRNLSRDQNFSLGSSPPETLSRISRTDPALHLVIVSAGLAMRFPFMLMDIRFCRFLSISGRHTVLF